MAIPCIKTVSSTKLLTLLEFNKATQEDQCIPWERHLSCIAPPRTPAFLDLIQILTFTMVNLLETRDQVLRGHGQTAKPLGCILTQKTENPWRPKDPRLAIASPRYRRVVSPPYRDAPTSHASQFSFALA